jgi:hypothetical protein
VETDELEEVVERGEAGAEERKPSMIEAVEENSDEDDVLEELEEEEEEAAANPASHVVT